MTRTTQELPTCLCTPGMARLPGERGSRGASRLDRADGGAKETWCGSIFLRSLRWNVHQCHPKRIRLHTHSTRTYTLGALGTMCHGPRQPSRPYSLLVRTSISLANTTWWSCGRPPVTHQFDADKIVHTHRIQARQAARPVERSNAGCRGVH